MGEREYVHCKNPACRPKGNAWISWKYVDLLPAACVYCNTKFKDPKGNRWGSTPAKRQQKANDKEPKKDAPDGSGGSRREDEEGYRKWMGELCKKNNPDLTEQFLADTHQRGVPASEKVDLVNFLVDQGPAALA